VEVEAQALWATCFIVRVVSITQRGLKVMVMVVVPVMVAVRVVVLASGMALGSELWPRCGGVQGLGGER
jgi:hypothetical protein